MSVTTLVAIDKDKIFTLTEAQSIFWRSSC